MLRGEGELAREGGGGAAGIHCTVAMVAIRALAGGAAIGIGLADDDGLRFDLGMAGDHREGFVNLTELIGDDHAHMSIDLLGAAFGMEGDEIERRAGFTRGSVLALETVIEKGLQKSRRPCHC